MSRARFKRLARGALQYSAIVVATLVVVDLLTIALGVLPPTHRYGDPAVGWFARLPTGRMEQDQCTEFSTGEVLTFARNEDAVRTSLSAQQLREDASLFKVAVSGDSQTELCARNQDTHFGVMERELRAADVNAAVFAYSAGRYSPLQAYLAVRKPARDYSASAVVLNVYTGNDFYDMLRVDDRPHLRRNNGGYEIAEPTWYVYDPPEVRHRSRVLHALRSLTNAIGVRELWLRTKYLRDFAGQQGKGLAVVVAYMNDLRKSRAPEVGYPGAFSAQILNQQLFFHRFPESRDESVARVRALLELARREIPGALLVLSALPSYQLVQQQPVDSALLRTLARLPVTYEGGVREEAALYESLRTLAAQAGWLFVDNLQPLREYQGRERLYNAFDYHFQPAASEIIGRAQATAIADHLRRPSMTGTAPAAR